MIDLSLGARLGHEISDEDAEAYVLGYLDALRDLVDDEVFYNALGGKPGALANVEEAANYLKSWAYDA